MKNIHLLPTDKPSRLVQRRITKEIKTSSLDNPQLWNNINIYITSDEEIKEGDWFYDLDSKYVKIKQSWENSHLDFNAKKIILTTHHHLIKDGIQAIDDEFLEWFVKNPSCEFVEIKKGSYNLSPMEEMLEKEYVPKGTFDTYKIIIPQEEHKQETLEEAAEKLFPINSTGSCMEMLNKHQLYNSCKQEGFIEGAKWQAERMYSEQEVLAMLLIKHEGLSPEYVLQQFKKK
jgi:hypothetical protein